MARLLQGDVGSGKTAVAIVAIDGAVRAGRQAALMAPTELLAEQLEEVQRVDLGLAGVFALRVVRRLEELHRRDPGNLDRVLERHEQALAGPLVLDERDAGTAAASAAQAGCGRERNASLSR